MAISGVSFIVSVNTGTGASPVWTPVAGQRDARLHLETGELDATSKDSSHWHEGEPGIRNWSLTFETLVSETDDGLAAVEASFLEGAQLHLRLATAAGHTYTGYATLAAFSYNMPYNNVVTASGLLAGDGALTKV